MNQSSIGTLLLWQKLAGLEEGSCYNVFLLFASQFVEVYRIAGDSDRKLWVFFRMIHGIKQRFAVEYIHVDVMSALAEVSVE